MKNRRYLNTLPTTLCVALGLDDQAAVGSRRIEIGGGRRPTDGYIHVDSDRCARHVEYFASAERLPFADAWAREILAIHVLEHIHPADLGRTLREWYRVLAPGGRLNVHVPDSAALMRAFLTSSIASRWSLTGALLGMYANPTITRPEDLEKPCDHQILFDWELLESVLRDAGFSRIVDRSSEIRDVHSEGWRELLPQISLIVEARKPRD